MTVMIGSLTEQELVATAQQVQKNRFGLIGTCAAQFKLDPLLVMSIVCMESSGNPAATRHEPKWRYPFFPREWADRLGIEYDLELTEQSTSWGLMQVMGSVARELGLEGRISTALVVPEAGLHYGCAQLARLRVHATEEADLIASYNAGSARKTPGGLYVNQRYVDTVSGFLRFFRKLV